MNPDFSTNCPVREGFRYTPEDASSSSVEFFVLVAGFVPATHVLAAHSVDRQEGADAHGSSPWAEGPRATPGQWDSSIVPSPLHSTSSRSVSLDALNFLLAGVRG